ARSGVESELEICPVLCYDDKPSGSSGVGRGKEFPCTHREESASEVKPSLGRVKISRRSAPIE
ncbi:hypothetical protein TNCV_5036911, partial [Trichonephila clavipes]